MIGGLFLHLVICFSLFMIGLLSYFKGRVDLQNALEMTCDARGDAERRGRMIDYSVFSRGIGIGIIIFSSILALIPLLLIIAGYLYS